MLFLLFPCFLCFRLPPWGHQVLRSRCQEQTQKMRQIEQVESNLQDLLQTKKQQNRCPMTINHKVLSRLGSSRQEEEWPVS